MQRKSISRVSIVATPLMIVCGILAAGVCAVAQPEDRHCSNRTLFGDYGFAIEGTILGANIPTRALSMTHYNGNGTLTQVDHAVTNGVPPTQEWTAGTGTYTVNPDCTGVGVIYTPSHPFPVHLHFILVNNGREIRQVVDANAIVAVGKKVD